MDNQEQPSGHQEQTEGQGTQEWADILRRLEDQVRRQAARVVGVDPEASSWSDIGSETDDAARRGAAKALGLDPEADWDVIGSKTEQQVRGGIAQVVGSSPEADWQTIGNTVDRKVRSFLDGLLSNKSKKPEASPESDEPIDPWQ